jgi:arylsulfatase A-like enzyme
VVVVLADDMGWGDLGCYNRDSRIAAPRLERLAAEGVRFTDMHSPSAVCTPTRYGLLTGRYCWRSSLTRGVLNGYSPSLIEPGRQTLATLCRSRGYETACFGKWHLGLGKDQKTDYSRRLDPSPLNYGFDKFFGIPASLDMPPYLWVEDDRCVEQPSGTVADSAGPRPRGSFYRGGPIAPSFSIEGVLPEITRRAVSWIETRRSNPFFLYLPLTAPHTPWMPLPEFRGRSRAGEYGDFVAQVDRSVDQVLRALDRTGAARDTLFIFTSDNGSIWLEEDRAATGHASNGHWRGMKADIYEGGHRVPFIARWPGRVKPGTVADEPTCLTGMFATLATVLGARLDDDSAEDSFSFAGSLEGRPRPARMAHGLVLHSSGGRFAIRQDQWKLVDGRGAGGMTYGLEVPDVKPAAGEPSIELYDLDRDPREIRNLASSYPEVTARLNALLRRYRTGKRSRPPGA